MSEDNQLPHLLNALDPLQIGENHYLGKNFWIGSPQVYGGQVLAQAIAVAYKSVNIEKKLHSIHAYFIHAGDHDKDIEYKVEIVKTGKTFDTRRVVAFQKNKEIFIFSASFHLPENGIEHQDAKPNVPDPETLVSFSELFQKYAAQYDLKPRGIYSKDGAFVFHPVEEYNPFQPLKRAPFNHVWFRTNGPIPNDERIHNVAIAYASDFNLLMSALFPHGISFFTTPMRIASLDHAMWSHRSAKADDWLLYAIQSNNASGGRAFCTGKIYNQQGILIASTAQEGLIRIL